MESLLINFSFVQTVSSVVYLKVNYWSLANILTKVKSIVFITSFIKRGVVISAYTVVTKVFHRRSNTWLGQNNSRILCFSAWDKGWFFMRWEKKTTCKISDYPNAIMRGHLNFLCVLFVRGDEKVRVWFSNTLVTLTYKNTHALLDAPVFLLLNCSVF